MAAPDFNALLLRGRAFFNSYAENLLAIYAEKGFEPFKKPLAISVPVLAVLYLVGYRPLGDKIISAAYKLESYQAVAQSAGEFTETRDRLNQLQEKLPPFKDKDDWLNALLSNSVKKFGLSFDQLSPQTEMTSGNYVIATRTAEFTATYDVAGKWLADLEATPQLVRIVNLSIMRDSSNPLQVRLSVTISTVFPKNAPQPGGGI